MPPCRILVQENGLARSGRHCDGWSYLKYLSILLILDILLCMGGCTKDVSCGVTKYHFARVCMMYNNNYLKIHEHIGGVMRAHTHTRANTNHCWRWKCLKSLPPSCRNCEQHSTCALQESILQRQGYDCAILNS